MTLRRPRPAAMAFAPSVLPVPAGPRSRKFRILAVFPLDAMACLQTLITCFGRMYHGSNMGIRPDSLGFNTRAGFRVYFPAKSL